MPFEVAYRDLNASYISTTGTKRGTSRPGLDHQRGVGRGVVYMQILGSVGWVMGRLIRARPIELVNFRCATC
jgi:hypothetical protein